MPLGATATLQQQATEAGEGRSFPLLGAEEFVFEVVHGGNGGTVVFEAQGPSGAYYAVLAENLTTGEKVTEARSPGLYRLAVKGIGTIQARIADDLDGDVSVYGTPALV